MGQPPLHELILEAAGGTLHSGVIDIGGPPRQRGPITLRLAQIERALGIRIEAGEVQRILTALGLEWLGKTDHVGHCTPTELAAGLGA